jgi:thymidylate kinase
LLDKDGGFGRHRQSLQHLARTTTGEGPVEAFLRTLMSPAVCWELHQGCAVGDWDHVRRTSVRLRRDWLRARPGPVLRRRLVNGALQGSTKPLVAARRRGVSVVLLGPDGAGKSTTAAAFATTYPFGAAHLYGGHYGRPLRIPPGVPGLGLAVRLARQLRTDAVATGHRLRGRVAVYDRHAYDAMVRPAGPTGRRARVRRRLLSRLALTPDLVVVLDASPELLFRRSGEHSVEQLAQQRGGYLDLAAALPHAVVVDAHHDPEQVRRDVTSAVWRRQVAAWSRPARRGPRRVKS